MLPSTFVRIKVGFLLFTVLTVLILTGCSGRVPQTTSNIQDQAGASSDYYLRQLRQSSDKDKVDLQLLAIGALLREGKHTNAIEQLNALPRDLNSSQHKEQQLLRAELQVAQKNDSEVNYILTRLKPESLTVNQQVRYYQAQANANQGKPTLALVRAYIAQEPLLFNRAHQENIDKTWQTLMQLDSQTLKNVVINVDERTLQGWLDLLDAWHNSKQDRSLLQAAIKDWQTRYPKNPAAKTLPTLLNQLDTLTSTPTTKIGLLLPLSGPAKIFGDAIQQGFIAAKNGLLTIAPSQPAVVVADQESITATTSEAQPVTEPIVTPELPVGDVEIKAYSHVEIKTYDTARQSVTTLLDQAHRDGASLIVGPLLKPDVEQLPNIPTSLNILALNQPETYKNSLHICYFALSPEDEARDAARYMWQQQKQTPLLLTPRGAFGDRIIKAFTEEWYNQGGLTVLQQTFGSSAELRRRINSGTGIRMTGNPVSTSVGVTRIPTDNHVDSVYIVATPSELTLIKPMIDMATSSRAKPALFASSRSYQAGTGADYRLEMEGIQFSEIPLIAGANGTLMRQAAAKFSNDYSLVRLYAMGIDSWTLASHFAEIRQLSDFKIAGLTGTLSATSSCIIKRQLPWLRYSNGIVVPVTSY